MSMRSHFGSSYVLQLRCKSQTMVRDFTVLLEPYASYLHAQLRQGTPEYQLSAKLKVNKGVSVGRQTIRIFFAAASSRGGPLSCDDRHRTVRLRGHLRRLSCVGRLRLFQKW